MLSRSGWDGTGGCPRFGYAPRHNGLHDAKCGVDDQDHSIHSLYDGKVVRRQTSPQVDVEPIVKEIGQGIRTDEPSGLPDGGPSIPRPDG
jgi:hypothetical protein